MHIHIIGICGTFMAGIASIAKALSFTVTGCDEHIYPPMSDVLDSLGVTVTKGYEALPSDFQPDLYVIGNAAKRGMPIIEDILTNKYAYMSGPEWLYQHVLHHKKVLAVSGTHGKTTTSSLLAWVLDYCGKKPSFLIGGVPLNFEASARCNDSDYFVIEADEYDTAFFDKRSKMVHYRPDIAIINNLEFDHADIFDNLTAIQKQFHGMVRVMPKEGLLICPSNIKAIDDLISMGCWSQIIKINDALGLKAELMREDGSQFKLFYKNKCIAVIEWALIGWHNVQNALAVMAVCLHLALPLELVTEAFSLFKSVKRRLELKKTVRGVSIYDDFAHHPTAIKLTVRGLRDYIGDKHLISIVDFGSHTMRSGLFFDEIIKALETSDNVFLLNAPKTENTLPSGFFVCCSLEALGEKISQLTQRDNVLIMSNKGNQALLEKLYQIL